MGKWKIRDRTLQGPIIIWYKEGEQLSVTGCDKFELDGVTYETPGLYVSFEEMAPTPGVPAERGKDTRVTTAMDVAIANVKFWTKEVREAMSRSTAPSMELQEAIGTLEQRVTTLMDIYEKGGK